MLVVSQWHYAPRYGFLSEFRVDEDRPRKLERLAHFHLTALQFTSMYRHYAFRPRGELPRRHGRRLSMEPSGPVTEHPKALTMAAVAYSTVYGAEQDSPRRGAMSCCSMRFGDPFALIKRFYVTDHGPRPYTQQLVGGSPSAIRRCRLRGRSTSTRYGVPKRAFDATGAPVDLGPALRDLVDEAAAQLAEVTPGAAVMFNAVNDWPVDEVARSGQAAVYIEVWEPHVRYRDLVRLAGRARDLSGKQVVLAAYLTPFREGGPRALAAARLVTAVIATAGAHHLLLGEGNGVLRDPYYPNHGHLDDEGVRHLQRAYDHTAAFHRYLFDTSAVDVSRTFATGENAELELVGAPVTAEPQAGAVWIRTVQIGDGTWVVNLVNLVGLDNDRWNEAHGLPTPMSSLDLRLGPFVRPGLAVWHSPDDGAAPRSLRWDADASGASVVRLPALSVWGTLVLQET